MRVGGGGCNHLPPPRLGQPSSAGGRGRGTAPTSGGSGEGGKKRRSPGRALGKQGVGVGDPGGCSPALPAVSLAPREGGGEKDKKPKRAAPAGKRPPASRRQHLPRGRTAAPPRSLPRRHKVFTPEPECRQLTESPPAPLLPTRRTF